MRGAAQAVAFAASLPLLLAAAGCTAIGAQDAGWRSSFDYGPPREIRVCVLRSPDVSEARTRQILAAINADLSPFALRVSVPWVRDWRRPAFMEGGILRDVAARPLEPPCDRLLALVDRNPADALWGLLLLPEIVGSVETASHTRGYVVANRATLTQLWVPPAEVAVHEFYHLLGCPHARSRVACYRRIALLKREAGVDGFFPSVDRDGGVLRSRGEADARAIGWASAPRE